ncbi:hypothetical protein [Flyfo microvirus Tbat2_130]|nr:hypothetical protein [Flyfo microvirus Tbat2_130]
MNKPAWVIAAVSVGGLVLLSTDTVQTQITVPRTDAKLDIHYNGLKEKAK